MWRATKGASVTKGVQCIVKLLDGSDLVLNIAKKTTGKDLFEQVLRRLEITQSENFCLAYEDEHRITQWIDPSKAVRKLIKRTPYRVSLKVRYYPLDPMVSHSRTRTHIYQQIKKDIVEAKLRCPLPFAPNIISYILQADAGDFESMEKDLEYMTDQRLVSSEDVQLQEDISQSHKLLRGLNPLEAVNGFLRKIRDLESYGISYYDVRQDDANSRIGLSPGGISFYQRNRRVGVHDWNELVQVSFKGKKLMLVIQESKGKEKHETLERDSSKAAKELWTICAAYASFYCQPHHRLREERSGLHSPVSPISSDVDIFGYPIDSRNSPSMKAKVKKSRSLPRSLPSDDPVLMAAMSHRKRDEYFDDPFQNQRHVTPRPVSLYASNQEPTSPNGSNMQIISPDMPRVIGDLDNNHTPYTLNAMADYHGTYPRRSTGPTPPRQDSSSPRTAHHSNHHQHNDQAQTKPLAGRDGNLGHSQQIMPSGDEVKGDLRSRSNSRLSRSSHNTANQDGLSQEDDMDGSLLDLADELGEGESSSSLKHDPEPQEYKSSPDVKTSMEMPPSGGHVSQSPNRSQDTSQQHNSHTLPWLHGSPGSSPPPKPPHDSPTSPRKEMPSLTSGHEHAHKQKGGRHLVRKWVQEQQLRTHSQSSLGSSSSGSIGTTPRHSQRSPDIRASKAKHTPPSPLGGNKSAKGDRDIQPYAKENHERENGFQESSHYDVLPGYKLPKQGTSVTDSAFSRHRDYSLSSDLPKLSQGKDDVTVHTDTSDSRESKPNDASLNEPDTTQKDLLKEIDVLMGSLVADTEAMFSDAGLSALTNQEGIRSQSLSSKNNRGVKEAGSHGSERLDVINRAEQVRHSKRASERKLRNSQRIVNQVLSESKKETSTSNKARGHKYDLADNSTSNGETSDGHAFGKDLNGAEFSREEFPVDPGNYVDAPLIYDHLNNVFPDKVPLPTAASVPNWVKPMPQYRHSPKDQTPSSDFSLSGNQVTSPLGEDLRDILQEVKEGDTFLLPPPHLVALSQDLETRLSSQRSPDPSSVSDYILTVSPQSPPTSPLEVSMKAPSSLSFTSKSSSDKQKAARFDKSLLSQKEIDLHVPVMDRKTKGVNTTVHSSAKLPPEIASFMSRVRNISLDKADSSHSLSQSDGVKSSCDLAQVNEIHAENKKQLDDSNAKTTVRNADDDTPPATHANSPPPLMYDSPRMLKVKMSKTPSNDQPSLSNDSGMLKKQNAKQKWVDDDVPHGYNETKIFIFPEVSRALSASTANSRQVENSAIFPPEGKDNSTHVNSSSPDYDTPRTVCKLQVDSTHVNSVSPDYDTPRTVRKLQVDSTHVNNGSPDYDTPQTVRKLQVDSTHVNSVSPDYDTPRTARKLLGEGISSVVYPEQSSKSRKEALETSSFSQAEKLKGHGRYNSGGASQDQQKHPVLRRHRNSLTDRELGDQGGVKGSRPSSWRHSKEYSSNQPHNSNPCTPNTPLSQQTHSDLIGHTFAYPNQLSAPIAPVSSNIEQHQNPVHSSQGKHPQELDNKPETDLLMSNPRSRNYRSQPPSHGGREAGRSSHRYNDNHCVSPGDDSIPNSPTYFTQNNPNDDRDTPSPGTQVQNELFQKHLKQLEVKGTKKLRVLDWMQHSSLSWEKKKKGSKPVVLSKDVESALPSKPYSKRTPIYASIDDVDGEQVSGSGLKSGSGREVESRQRDTGQRQISREKLTSQSASGHDMEQRHDSRVSRPFTRYDLEQRRFEIEQTSKSGYDPRSGSGRDMSFGKRRAYTVSQTQAKVHQGQGSLGSQERTGPVAITGQSSGTSMNVDYPTAKFGKDFYVIDV